MIAALSMVNSILAMSGASIRFIFGLGLSQIVDALPIKPARQVTCST